MREKRKKERAVAKAARRFRIHHRSGFRSGIPWILVKEFCKQLTTFPS